MHVQATPLKDRDDVAIEVGFRGCAQFVDTEGALKRRHGNDPPYETTFKRRNEYEKNN